MKLIFSKPTPKQKQVSIQLERTPEAVEFITGFHDGKILNF
jgi:hypothetical protein